MKNYWQKTILSFVVVLFTMPLGHAVMIIMERTLEPTAVHWSAFALGLLGMILTAWGVFVRGDTRQTLCGFFGALLFWTGWVEFLFQYYANRFGVQPEIVNGEVVTKPEYLILPATFGLWAMVMLLYLFSSRNGCNFINWWQGVLFRGRKTTIAARSMTRHVSIVTFMEFNMIMWTCYLVLMVCYDSHFLGDHHPVTYGVGLLCFIGAILMFRRQLHIGSWGGNIRMSIATVIVFWTPMEILMRNNVFKEIWVEPHKYVTEMLIIAAVFVLTLAYIIIKNRQHS